jgi:ATP-binding protein involved in chromosome partitioning
MTSQVRRTLPDSKALEKIKNIVGCGSGKGGVGKSTVAVNLALALAAKGSKVGLLDADIYGPNVPGMLGIQGRPELRVVENKIIPIEKFGLKVLSMGFLLEEGSPVIWRGPMLHGVIKQFLFDCEWGELDYLIIDLPPGTGDVQLTLSQLVPLTGVVIVSTPQNVALQDVRKAIAMFQKTQVPLLGLIENMSYFLCPKCGERSEIFSHGGGRKEAEKWQIPFLGEIPLQLSIREAGDTGEPILLVRPESAEAEAFRHAAGEAARQISIRAFSKKPVFNFPSVPTAAS